MPYMFLVYVLFASFLFAQDYDIPSSIKDQIRESGLSNDQLKDIINSNSSNGSLPEILNNDLNLSKKIDVDIEKKQVQNNLKDLNASISSIDLSGEGELEEKDVNQKINESEELVEDKIEINIDASIDNTTNVISFFGYNIFDNDPKLFDLSNSPNIDPNYIVGPGDEIVIMLWGQTEINQAYIVSLEGYLFIENVGQIFVNGLTMEKLEVKLFKLLKRVYSSLGSPNESNASTFFDLSLGSLAVRPTRVFVLGEVIQPGAYSMNPSTTLFSSLFYFKGPTEAGSLRNIQLIRGGKVIKTIDFYDYLLNGKKLNDSKLQRDDIIFIPNRGKTVAIKGEVNRAAIFELIGSEDLKSVLEMAGGLKSTSYTKRAQIKRITPASKRNKIKMDRSILDISLNNILSKKKSAKSVELFDGDTLEIFKISGIISNSVKVSGAVNRPGDYQFFDNMKISDLLDLADGVTMDAFLQKVDIVRKKSYLMDDQIVIDLLKALNGDTLHDVFLKPNDIITIYGLSEMLDKGSVLIDGHVFNPGTKPYYGGMTAYDLIFLGGGFKNKNHLKNTYLERADLLRFNNHSLFNNLISFNLDSLFTNKDKFNFVLQADDKITVYSKIDITGDSLQTISIEGQVKYPGTYELTENMSLKELFFAASGFKDLTFFKSVLKNRFDIIRNVKGEDRKKVVSLSLAKVLSGELKHSEIILEPNDLVRIYGTNLVDFSNFISIEGRIAKPGEYTLKDKMSLGDLILEAGGLDSSIYGFRAEVSRVDPKNKTDNLYASLYVFDFEHDIKLFEQKNEKNNKINFLLKSDDLVIIRSNPLFSKQEKVTISGYVYFPGDYVITNSDEKVSDIIIRAGGLRPEGYALASTLERNSKVIRLNFDKIIKNPRSSFNFTVLPNDVININAQPNLVIISGEVYDPGSYQYFKGYRLNDYIALSGGLKRDASKYSSFVTYPNGETKRIKFLRVSPKVVDGSIITIGTKADVVPFNLTQYATSITDIYSQFIQLYLLLALSNNSNS